MGVRTAYVNKAVASVAPIVVVTNVAPTVVTVTFVMVSVGFLVTSVAGCDQVVASVVSVVASLTPVVAPVIVVCVGVDHGVVVGLVLLRLRHDARHASSPVQTGTRHVRSASFAARRFTTPSASCPCLTWLSFVEDSMVEAIVAMKAVLVSFMPPAM